MSDSSESTPAASVSPAKGTKAQRLSPAKMDFDRNSVKSLTFKKAKRLAFVANKAMLEADRQRWKQDFRKRREFLVWDNKIDSFAIRVFKEGTRTFLVRRRIRGGSKSQKEITVGNVATMKFDDAAAEACNFILQMRKGVDPVAKKVQTEDEKKAHEVTLHQIFDLYETKNQKKKNRGLRRANTLRDMAYVLQHYMKDFWDMPVSKITKKQCQVAFRSITAQGAPRQANKAITYLRTLMNIAREEYCTDDGEYPILKINPAALAIKADPLNPAGARTGRIEKQRIRVVWQALKQRGELGATADIRTGADWLRFRMMTGTRVEESRVMRYAYINWKGNSIVLPASITKTHQELPIAITPQMRELLEHRRALYLAAHPGAQEPPADAYVFPSEHSKLGHLMSARMALKAIAGKAITEYDTRRTFEDVATECRVDPLVRYRLLNHALNDVHLKNYANNPVDLVAPMFLIAAWLDTPPCAEEVAVAPVPAQVPEVPEDLRAWRSLQAPALAKLVWALPASTIATVYEVSDVAINKRCKAFGIVRPPRGYWQKLAVGRVSEWPRRT